MGCTAKEARDIYQVAPLEFGYGTLGEFPFGWGLIYTPHLHSLTGVFQGLTDTRACSCRKEVSYGELNGLGWWDIWLGSSFLFILFIYTCIFHK